MEPIVMTFGTALVKAIATDSWQQARNAVVRLWQRVRPPHQAETVEAELADLRERVLAARRAERTEIEEAVTGVWQGRLQELLLDEPELAIELRRILAETLTPMLAPAEQVRISRVVMTGNSHDNSTLNQTTGNQTNVWS